LAAFYGVALTTVELKAVTEQCSMKYMKDHADEVCRL
jgi:hypothetical protein